MLAFLIASLSLTKVKISFLNDKWAKVLLPIKYKCFIMIFDTAILFYICQNLFHNCYHSLAVCKVPRSICIILL